MFKWYINTKILFEKKNIYNNRLNKMDILVLLLLLFLIGQFLDIL